MKSTGCELVSLPSRLSPNLHYYGECAEACSDVAKQQMHMMVSGPERRTQRECLQKYCLRQTLAIQIINMKLQEMSTVTHSYFRLGFVTATWSSFLYLTETPKCIAAVKLLVLKLMERWKE